MESKKKQNQQYVSFDYHCHCKPSLISYKGFSDAVITFQTKINILLMHQYPLFNDIVHVLISLCYLS